jgi:phosphatidylserine/phosphatidylglycerophosphate/cardiolipin synthase-like enzyme
MAAPKSRTRSPVPPLRLPVLGDEPSAWRRTARVELLADRRHYDDVVLKAILGARVSIWIATANLKDVHVEAPIGSVARARGRYVSLTERFEGLVQGGVEIRILHGALPSGPFRESLAKRRGLRGPRFELRHCPRVHLKMIVVDGAYLYLGSANFTGAGLGAKGEGRRNFEMGVALEDDVLLDAAQARFERIWSGRECGACRLRSVCPAPLDMPRAKRSEVGPKRVAPRAKPSGRPKK